MKTNKRNEFPFSRKGERDRKKGDMTVKRDKNLLNRICVFIYY